jgi:aminoglycoside phosphotransferase (APT) family kinase protein
MAPCRRADLLGSRHAGSTREERAGVYDAMNAALAQLHAIDVEAAGLSDYGKPGNYFARQVAALERAISRQRDREIADMNRLIDWLGAHMPPDDGRVALVHGDYRIDNMIFDQRVAAPARRARLGAFDARPSVRRSRLSMHAMALAQRQCDFRGLDGARPRRARHSRRTPTMSRLIAGAPGIESVPHWPFLIAFSFFRIAAIVQGVYKRALDGNASNPERGIKMGAAVPLMAKLAMAEAEGTRG